MAQTGPTREQQYIAEIIVATMGTLSLISSSIIILSIVTFPKLRGFSNRLVLYLSIADLGFCLVILVQAYSFLANESIQNNPTACDILGTLMHFFKQCGNFWAGFIAFSLYMKVCRHESARYYEKKFLIASTTISAVCATIAGAYFRMGPSGAWCWIRKNKIQVYGHQLLFYDFVYIILLTIIASYARIIYEVIITKRKMEAKTVRCIHKLAFFPLAFMFVWVPPIVRRIYELDHPFTFGGLVVQSILNPSDGFLNLIGYGIYRKLLPRYIALLKDKTRRYKTKDDGDFVHIELGEIPKRHDDNGHRVEQEASSAGGSDETNKSSHTQ
jgi:hypothetical protein